MFYSQTFLARKGPLGTVWCAAHLQHRLKKSHYTSTDIPSTVERIMFPEVPIALRMSGHLLLGVVRIYSKKVDYLYHDCNVVLIGLRKTFSSTDVNLPENATTAKFESVTLPQIVDLDALDVDDCLYFEGSPDNHLRDQEEITLTDQIPIGRDLYVTITFDDDVLMDELPRAQDPDSGARSMDEDNLPPPPVDHDVGFQETMETVNGANPVQDFGLSGRIEVLTEPMRLPESGPTNQTEVLTGTAGFEDPGPSNLTEILNPKLMADNSPPEFEVIRDAAHDFSAENLHSVFPDHQEVGVQLKDPVFNEKEIPSPVVENDLASRRDSLLFQQHVREPTSAASEEAPDIFDARVSFGHISPGLAIRSTPSVQQPQRRQRKRKNFFDESTVLTNKLMKKALEDCSDLLRKRRGIPSSALGIWKFGNSLIKEQVFDGPLVTGLSADICNLTKKDYVSTKPHLILDQAAVLEPNAATSPAPSTEAIQEPVDARSPASVNETIQESANARSPALTNKAIPGTSKATSPAPLTETIPVSTAVQSIAEEPEMDIEIEHLRHHQGHDANDVFHGLLPSPARATTSPGRFMSSPFGIDDFTLNSPQSLGFESVPHAGTTAGTEVLPTPDIAASTGTYASELETPRTFLEERFGADNTALSGIPEWINTAEADDLSFLEADNTPGSQQKKDENASGLEGTQGIDSLSVRTRAVAQYLKRHSPISSMSEDPKTNLSLNKILQGKSRKLAARMFFETLVLKSHELVDVQQEQPYADIALKLTPTLSKAQI